MADEAGASGWVSIGKAARALGVSKSAIRKRLDAGTLAARDDGGSTKVLLPFARPNVASASGETAPDSDGSRSSAVAADAGGESPPNAANDDERRLAALEAPAAGAELAAQVAALTERAAQLAARLAEAQAERDRWLAAAAEAHNDARAAVAARDEAEREMRLLLARAQFEPALPPGAPSQGDAPPSGSNRRRWRFWRR
ncbi:MAG TPA: hypothetical protein VFQ80_15730 [Thermomicrobiales bacterium]|nr:hypothetical protein [Thermomicrobiales bacterium]